VGDLVVEPDRLRSVLESARARRVRGDGLACGTIAECSFRLALHPDTAPDEALDLLRRAMRLDGANPRYSYHVGRLLFTHGHLREAGVWLQHAASMCPTSHRVMAHISLLQREIDLAIGTDQEHVPEALKRRASELARKVLGGDDAIPWELLDTAPPRRASRDRSLSDATRSTRRGGGNPVGSESATQVGGRRTISGRRRLNPGVCRWDGLEDALLDQTLESEVSNRRLDSMSHTFERLVQRGAAAGSGSRAAIAAIEWLVAGYPSTVVRRLFTEAGLEASGFPSVALALRVADIMDAPEEDVAHLLADAVKREAMPVALAAAIHRRRLLYYPLEYAQAAAYRRAQALARNTGTDGLAARERAEVSRELAWSIRNLEPAPTVPPQRLGSSQAVAAEDAGRMLRRLEEFARVLKSLETDLLAHIRDRLLPATAAAAGLEEQAVAAADVTALTRLVDGIEAATGKARERLEVAVAAAAAGGDPGLATSLTSRRDACHAAIADVSNLGKYRRLLRSAEAALLEVTSAAQPSAAVKTLHESAGPILELACLSDRVPNAQDHAEEESCRESKDAIRVPTVAFSTLEEALDQTALAVDRFFGRAAGGFREYPASALLSGPLATLLDTVDSRHAETLAFMGLRGEACKVWSRILRRDRTNLAALKNLAVSATVTNDPRSGHAWRAYAEMLHIQAAVLEDVTAQAPARRSLYESIGRAHAPGFLFCQDEAEWHRRVDPDAVVSWLASPRRVRAFVDGTSLAYLETLMGFKTPQLVIGLDRSAGPGSRARAIERVGVMAVAASSLWPERARAVYLGLVQRRLRDVTDQLGRPRSAILRGDRGRGRYEEERAALIRTMTELIKLKVRILSAVMDSARQLCVAPKTAQGLCELGRLDRLPLDLSAELLHTAAGSITGIHDIGDLAPRLLGGILPINLLRQLQVDAEAGQIPQQVVSAYERAITLHTTSAAMALGSANSLIHREAYGEALELLTSLSHDDMSSQERVDCARARMLCLFHLAAEAAERDELGSVEGRQRQALAEAEYILEHATDPHVIQEARTVRSQMATLGAQLLIRLERYDHAEGTMKLMDDALEHSQDTEEESGLRHMRMQLALALARHAVSCGDRGGLRRWAGEAVSDATFVVHNATQDIQRNNADEIAAGASTLAIQLLTAAEKWTWAVSEIDAGLQDPNADATRLRYFRMICSFSLMRAAKTSGDDEGAHSHAVRATRDADHVLAHSEDVEQQRQARAVKTQAARALGQVAADLS
jgi:hypothetical protein